MNLAYHKVFQACISIRGRADLSGQRQPSQVLAIMEKESDGRVYSTIKHVAKGLNLNNLVLSENISQLLSLENYVPRGAESN